MEDTNAQLTQVTQMKKGFIGNKTRELLQAEIQKTEQKEKTQNQENTKSQPRLEREEPKRSVSKRLGEKQRAGSQEKMRRKTQEKKNRELERREKQRSTSRGNIRQKH